MNKICRIVSLKGFKGVLIGRDLSKVLTAGHVYAAMNISGVIVLEDLGKHAHPDWDLDKKGNPKTQGKISQYVMSPCVYLTKKERELELKNKPELDEGGFKTDPVENWAPS